MTAPPTAAIVGTGLIGTSIGMALRSAGWSVDLYDRDPVTARQAAELGAGRVGSPGDAEVDLAVLAMGVPAMPAELVRAQEAGLARTYMDVGSVKDAPIAHARALGADLSCFIGSHPMAGRERSGPRAARADLFDGRPWVVVPGVAGEEHTRRVLDLVAACAAEPVLSGAAEHDHAMALVSHVPQVLASLTAARLAPARDDEVALAGSGVRDVTRIAASDADLWTGILEANAGPVGAVLAQVRDDLDRVLGALDSLAAPGGEDRASARDRVRTALLAGSQGRRRLPGKHGAPPTAYAVVPVVIADRYGQLARLFADAGAAQVSIEDVAIEHSPGHPVGLVELSVRPEAADTLTASLRELGWTVQR